MRNSPSVKVSKRHQIVLPSAARKQLQIEAGDRLLVDVQDGLLVLLPQPESYADRLAGLYADMWAGVDAADYIQQERDAWTSSGNG